MRKTDAVMMEALKQYRKAATSERHRSGCQGEREATEANLMDTRWAAYDAGLHGTVPAWLQPYVRKAERKLTAPEHVEYLRLKKKYEGK